MVVTARFGMLSEQVNVGVATLQQKPAAMSWAQAASFPVAWKTAYVALVRNGALKAGEALLVHGAAGGVGMAAIDVGLLLGARVIATASSAAKREALSARGVQHVLDPAKGFKDEVRRLTDGRGADVIFDPVGGDTFDESTRCIAFGGRLLVVGFASGRLPVIGANIVLIKGFSLVGVRAGEYGRQFPEHEKEDAAAIHRLAETGKIRPHIGVSAPFADCVSVMRALAARQVVGKAVVLFQ